MFTENVQQLLLKIEAYASTFMQSIAKFFFTSHLTNVLGKILKTKIKLLFFLALKVVTNKK